MAWEEKPKHELAYEDYKKGLKYREIAEKYGVSIGTVNSWKSRYWSKNSDKKSMHKDLCIENDMHRKPGAPKGNKNSYKHGIYENVILDTLDESERTIISNIDLTDLEHQIVESIKLYAIRERRFMQRIMEAKNVMGDLIIDNVARKKSLSKDGQHNGEVVTNAISSNEQIRRWEVELTKIQSQKGKLLLELNKFRQNKSPTDEEKNIDFSELTLLELKKLVGMGDKDD